MSPKRSDPRSWSRRSLLIGAGACSLAGVGTVSGYQVASRERDEGGVTRRLTVEEEFDVAETSPDSAGDDGPDGGEVSQRCNPNPDRIESRSHISHLSMIDEWSERYHIWGTEGTETGVGVYNSVVVEKAPERVGGKLLYGVRLYSLGYVEDELFSQLRLEQMEHELTVDSAVEIRSVLPSEPIRPADGTCTLTLMQELPSGWNAGYEETLWANDGVIDTEHDGDTVRLSFDGPTGNTAALQGLLELRSDRPLAELDDVFAWTVRGSATRRGL